MSKPKIIKLKYCPRTKHTKGTGYNRPLQKATKRCWNYRFGMCCFIPSVLKYCEENNIKVDFNTKFLCVLKRYDYKLKKDYININGKQIRRYVLKECEKR